MADVEKVIAKIIDIRDQLSERRKEFKDFEAKAKGDIEKLEAWILNKANEVGTDGFKTGSGSGYKKTKTQFRVADWDKIVDFVQRTNNFQMLEKRVAKNATKEIWDALQESGEVIPGIDFVQELVIEVRRASK